MISKVTVIVPRVQPVRLGGVIRQEGGRVGEGHPPDGLHEVSSIHGLFPTMKGVDLVEMFPSTLRPFFLFG